MTQNKECIHDYILCHPRECGDPVFYRLYNKKPTFIGLVLAVRFLADQA